MRTRLSPPNPHGPTIAALALFVGACAPVERALEHVRYLAAADDASAEVSPTPRATPYTVVLDEARGSLTLFHGSTPLRAFPVSRVELGSPRLPLLHPSVDVGIRSQRWENARIRPEPVRIRREVVQSEVVAAPDPAGGVSWIPPPPDSAIVAPPAFLVLYDGGLALLVESEPDEGGTRLGIQDLRALPRRVLPHREERHRLRVRLPREEAGALFRSLPEGSGLVILTTGSPGQSVATPSTPPSPGEQSTAADPS